MTKDEDFVVRKLLESGPPVVWVRIGNTRRVDLLRRTCCSSQASIHSAFMRIERRPPMRA